MNTLNSKEIIAIWFAVVAALVSITALWMPPQGIIDETVLILIGQFLLFIGTLIKTHPSPSLKGGRGLQTDNASDEQGISPSI